MSSKSWTEDQQKVIELRNRNILVSAAAGSGKTAVLVQRIIEMITDANHPMDIDELLVVTFTNAAAREMKERVRTAIEDALEQNPGDSHLIRQETLISNANISTIDSFCLQVLRNHFHKIDLDPEFRTGDPNEMKLLKQNLMEQFLEDKYAGEDPDFYMLADIYMKKGSDTAIKDIIFQLQDTANAFPWPMQWLDQAKAAYEVQTIEELKEQSWMKDMVQQWIQQLEEVKGEYMELLLMLKDTPGAPENRIPIIKSDLEFVEYLLESGNVDDLRLRKEGHGRYAVYTARKKGDPSNPDIDAAVKKKREMLKKQIETILKKATKHSLAQILSTLHTTRPVAQAFIALTKEYMEVFAKEKRRRNMIDFTDQEHFALQILVDEETGEPTDVAQEYQDQFREIMIDEYQDSNDVQELLLTSISRMSRGEYNYFMVGDVKQSIYGFRMAKPRIFMDKYLHYYEEDAKEQKIDLSKNFRSRSQVLSFTNELFYELMHADLGDVEYTKKEALYLGATYYDKADEAYRKQHPSISKAAMEAYYKPEILIGTYERGMLEANEYEDKHDFEAKLIADRIRKMVYEEKMPVFDQEMGALRPIQFRDIVILLRSTSTNGEKYMDALQSYGVPAHAVSTTGYFETTEVRTVLAFLSLLDNEYQDIPLASVLRSPIVGITNEKLLEIRSKEPKAMFHKAFFDYGRNHTEDQEVQGFLQLLQTYRERATYVSIHELITQFLEETHYLLYVSALPDGAVRKANLEKLVDMAISYENSSFKGLFRFVNYIEEAKKYETDQGVAEVTNENDDAVRIMTIHKSKGLEFPVVFVSNMGANIGHQSGGNALIHPSYGVAFDCIDPVQRVKYDSVYKDAMKTRIQLEERGEELRVLYVALTRAREKLILTGAVEDFKKKEEAIREDLGRMNFRRRSGASTYLDWILPVVIKQGQEDCITVKDSIGVAMHDVYDFVKAQAAKTVIANASPERLGEPYQYPYPMVSKYKNKYSVSEIKHQAMDQILSMEDAGTPQEFGIQTAEQVDKTVDYDPIIPQFMQSKETVNQGALRGTAMHRYMECYDFLDTEMERSFDRQMERMVCQGKVTEEQKDLISKEQICGFLQTKLAQRMHQAAKTKDLYIERAFVFGDKPSSLFAGIDEVDTTVEEPLIMVQGIIDAFFVETDGIILLDYKTDRVKNGTQLADLYRKQIDIYADAIARAYQMPVKERYLYSFSLQEVVPV